MRRTTGISLVLLLHLCSWVPLCADEAPWPMFQRNAARTGVTDAPAIEKPALLWNTRIGIQGYLNCPVIAGGRVFVGSSGLRHNKPDRLDGITAVDAKTGKVLWHHQTDKDGCGVAFDDGRIFATADDGHLRALRATDGTLLWKAKRRKELYCQPLVVGGRVIIGDAEGKVLAFDAPTGRIVWQSPDDAVAGDNVRGGLSCDGERIYAAFVNGALVCLDRDGKLVWKRAIPVNSGILNPRGCLYPAPTIAGKLLILGYARDTYYENPAVFALDKITGKPVWEAADPDRKRSWGNVRSSPAVWGDQLVYGEPYGADLVALGLADGKYRWHRSLGFPMFPHWSSPAVARDTLYLPRCDGGLYAVDLKQRRLKWKFYLGKHDRFGTQFPEGILPKDTYGTEWYPAFGQPLFASVAVDADGTLYVGTEEGYLCAIGETRR